MTDDEILALAEHHGMSRGDWPRMWDFARGELLHFARAVAAHEREANARVCDDIVAKHAASGAYVSTAPERGIYARGTVDGAEQCAAAIRSRT